MVPEPLFSLSKNIIIISKFEQVPLLNKTVFKNTDRIRRIAHLDLALKRFLRYICPKVLGTALHFISILSLIIKSHS